MSWSGTVTCSHCYRQGHNKRKCPELSERIKSEYEGAAMMAEKERAAGNDGDAKWYEERAEHRRQQYIKRTKIDLATGKTATSKVAKAERMKNVTCGYCRDSGHTRRTCEVLKRDKLVFVEESRRVRASVFEDAVNMGIGVGSLIPVRISGYHGTNGEWGSYTSLRYIRYMEWKSVCARRPALRAMHTEAGKLAYANSYRWTARDRISKLQENFKEARLEVELAGKPALPVSLIPSLDPPDGWLECERSTIDVAAAFPTTGNSYNKQRKHEYAWPSGRTVQVIRDLGLEEHWKGRF